VTLGGSRQTRYVWCCGRRKPGLSSGLADFMCEVLKSSWGGDLKESSPLIPDLEGVGDASREHDKAARLCIEGLVSAHNVDASVNDVEGFILSVMHVKRRAERRWSGLLDQRERPSGVVATCFYR
jgi:hypothetical protein